MSDLPQITPDFLEENEKLCQTMPKSESKKEGGPYPKSQKITRRNEVFKLHFEYGYSARKIADVMKINRNTINSDITYWYSHLKKQDDSITVDDWLNKLLYRLETQRSRLMEKLDRTTGFTNLMILEKMIFEIDIKLTQIMIKLQTTNQTQYDNTIKLFNDWLEQHGYKERYVLWGQTLRVTYNTSEKIKKIIRSDKYQKPVKSNHVSNSNSEVISQHKF